MDPKQPAKKRLQHAHHELQRAVRLLRNSDEPDVVELREQVEAVLLDLDQLRPVLREVPGSPYGDEGAIVEFLESFAPEGFEVPPAPQEG